MSAIKKRIYYSWKKLSEILFRKSFANDYYKNDIARFEACKDRKPENQIKHEMQVLQKYWDCYPYQYYRFDLYRKDCTLSLEELKKYTPYFYMHRLFYPDSYKEYGVLCEDKELTHAMLKGYDVLHPKMILSSENGNFYDNAGNSISASNADAIINESNTAKLFVKPRYGLGGKGIFVYTKNGGSYIDSDKKALDQSLFTNLLKTEAYIVEEGLVQHTDMNVLYPYSVNTFRIVTECVNGNAKILYSIVRMGRGGKEIDNASAGGIYTKIDAETGLLADQAYSTNREVFNEHPDTGFVYKGAKIERWDEIKQFTLAVARKFREIKYMGWDIAFSTDGPSVIELNHAPGISIIQDCYGGMRDVMKINPNDLWYKSNFTIKNL
jgi:hypothetical protein